MTLRDRATFDANCGLAGLEVSELPSAVVAAAAPPAHYVGTLKSRCISTVSPLQLSALKHSH